MERQKYALSLDEGASPDMRIPSPQPKMKDAELAPVKKEIRALCPGATLMSGSGIPRG